MQEQGAFFQPVGFSFFSYSFSLQKKKNNITVDMNIQKVKNQATLEMLKSFHLQSQILRARQQE